MKLVIDSNIFVSSLDLQIHEACSVVRDARPEQQSIDDGEHAGVQSDSQREREDRRRRQERMLPQQARGEAEVVEHQNAKVSPAEARQKSSF